MFMLPHGCNAWLPEAHAARCHVAKEKPPTCAEACKDYLKPCSTPDCMVKRKQCEDAAMKEGKTCIHCMEENK
jgi:hypothetical protein